MIPVILYLQRCVAVIIWIIHACSIPHQKITDTRMPLGHSAMKRCTSRVVLAVYGRTELDKQFSCLQEFQKQSQYNSKHQCEDQQQDKRLKTEMKRIPSLKNSPSNSKINTYRESVFWSSVMKRLLASRISLIDISSSINQIFNQFFFPSRNTYHERTPSVLNITEKAYFPNLYSSLWNGKIAEQFLPRQAHRWECQGCLNIPRTRHVLQSRPSARHSDHSVMKSVLNSMAQSNYFPPIHSEVRQR